MLRAFSPIVCGAVFAAWLCAPGEAQDVVELKSDSGRPPTRLVGTIVDYRGEGLRLRQSAGGEVDLPLAQVDHIETEWSDSHRKGNDLLKRKMFEEAVAAYRQAMEEEGRRWARRWIIAETTKCYQSMGRVEQAGRSFLVLLADDPSLAFPEAMPLAWGASSPGEGGSEQAALWLKSKQPAAALMGASWLLEGRQRAEAISKLESLKSDGDERLARLADAQLWRTRMVTADADEIERFRGKIEALPPPLRGGPLFLIGRAYARQDRHEEAALALMRTAIIHPNDNLLAADALLAAGLSLEELDRQEQAAGLYRELVSDYAGTRAATEAAARLQAAEDGS